MSKVIQFLDALKKELPNMFEVKEGAPMPEFWESFEAAYQEAAQQNAHLTPESLASSQAVVNTSALSKSDGDTPPAQAQVTQTVRQLKNV